MNKKQLAIMLLYLWFGCVIVLNVIALTTLFVARVFLFIAHNIPFEIASYDVFRYVKAAVFAGTVVGFGCWWIYYRHYSNKNC